MTPAQHRALASRVETEEPSDALNSDVAEAFGWTAGEHGIWWKSPDGVWRMGLPAWLTDLTAAASALPEGWTVHVIQNVPDVWGAYADAPEPEPGKTRLRYVNAKAPTEPRARTALALRARAAEMEARDGE